MLGEARDLRKGVDLERQFRFIPPRMGTICLWGSHRQPAIASTPPPALEAWRLNGKRRWAVHLTSDD